MWAITQRSSVIETSLCIKWALISKLTSKKKRVGSIAQMAECLPSKCETLNSSPVLQRKKKRIKLSWFMSLTMLGLFVLALSSLSLWIYLHSGLFFFLFLLFIYSHVHTLFGSFLHLPPFHLVPPPPPFQAEPVLRFSPVPLKSRHKQ
jgi:hypothetical protein